MTDLEKENLHLKATIKFLKEDNQKKLKTISSLNTIAVSLSNFKDVSSILKEILTNVQEVTNSDGVTIYLTDGKRLSFKHIVNKSLNIEHFNCDENEDIWNFFDIVEENTNLISVSCALTKKIICIDDVYNSNQYDFSGTKAFDAKIGYKSNTMLVAPMLLANNTLVGVLQLINKMDEHNNIIKYNADDEELAHSLASQASIAVDKFRQEKLLIGQSKMAAMGEMMDAVAHQWKQPLNALSMYSEIIKSDFEDGSVDKVYIDQFKDDMQVQIDHMVNTLDEFRTFFRPNKEHEMFSLLSIVHSVLFLTKDDLLKNRITVTIEKKDHIDINGSSNEFKHLILNIINNAKDAFNDNNIEKRIITIRLINNDEGKRMEIEDNAGGIPKEIIDDIFKANITSKEEGKGTGIGLYMSTQIATKHNAILSVKNLNDGIDGACFTITFNS